MSFSSQGRRSCRRGAGRLARGVAVVPESLPRDRVRPTEARRVSRAGRGGWRRRRRQLGARKKSRLAFGQHVAQIEFGLRGFFSSILWSPTCCAWSSAHSLVRDHGAISRTRRRRTLQREHPAGERGGQLSTALRAYKLQCAGWSLFRRPLFYTPPSDASTPSLPQATAPGWKVRRSLKRRRQWRWGSVFE